MRRRKEERDEGAAGKRRAGEAEACRCTRSALVERGVEGRGRWGRKGEKRRVEGKSQGAWDRSMQRGEKERKEARRGRLARAGSRGGKEAERRKETRQGSGTRGAARGRGWDLEGIPRGGRRSVEGMSRRGHRSRDFAVEERNKGEKGGEKLVPARRNWPRSVSTGPDSSRPVANGLDRFRFVATCAARFHPLLVSPPPSPFHFLPHSAPMRLRCPSLQISSRSSSSASPVV